MRRNDDGPIWIGKFAVYFVGKLIGFQLPKNHLQFTLAHVQTGLPDGCVGVATGTKINAFSGRHGGGITCASGFCWRREWLKRRWWREGAASHGHQQRGVRARQRLMDKTSRRSINATWMTEFQKKEKKNFFFWCSVQGSVFFGHRFDQSPIQSGCLEVWFGELLPLQRLDPYPQPE